MQATITAASTTTSFCFCSTRQYFQSYKK